jgi:hypothetical protein
MRKIELDDAEHTLGVPEVAVLLKKTIATVRSDIVRRPATLPPFFKLPGGRRVLWLKSTVLEFITDAAVQGNAAPRKREHD